jgi:hypothetical protein
MLFLIGPAGRLGDILGGIWLVIIVVAGIFLRGRFHRPTLDWRLRPLTLTPTQMRMRQANRLAIGALIVAVVIIIWAITRLRF